MFYSLQKQRKHREERSFGRPKGFESIKPTFRILSLYTKTGVSLITAGYRRIPWYWRFQWNLPYYYME